MARLTSAVAVQSYAKSSTTDRNCYLFSGQQKVALKSQCNGSNLTDLKISHSNMIKELSEHASELGLNYMLHEIDEMCPTLVIGPNTSSLVDEITGHLKLL